jgi:hypothetical protein
VSLRDFVLYVTIAVGVVAAILILAVYDPNITHAWFSFFFMTFILAAVLAKMYWPVRRSAKVWLFLLFFLAIHCGAYAVLLLHVDELPSFWYVLTMPVEVMLVLVGTKICLNVLPPKTRGLF